MSEVHDIVYYMLVVQYWANVISKACLFPNVTDTFTLIVEVSFKLIPRTLRPI